MAKASDMVVYKARGGDEVQLSLEGFDRVLFIDADRRDVVTIVADRASGARSKTSS